MEGFLNVINGWQWDQNIYLVFLSAALLPDSEVALEKQPKLFARSQNIYSVKFSPQN